MNEINKTGRMYVVWHKKSEVQSQQDGIDKVIESIGWTGAEYGYSVDDTKSIVRDAAIEHFDFREYNPITKAKPRSEEHRQAVQEFGQRAVYEVRISHVGYVDAEGKFRETRKKK